MRHRRPALIKAGRPALGFSWGVSSIESWQTFLGYGDGAGRSVSRIFDTFCDGIWSGVKTHSGHAAASEDGKLTHLTGNVSQDTIRQGLGGETW